MNIKPLLSFYTNIPTPYQLSFFDELAKKFELTVIYYSITENNREWKFNLNAGYKVIILKNNFIARLVQKKIVDFHFSWSIFKTVWRDKSPYVIVGGSYWIPNAATALILSKLRYKKVAYFTEPLFEVQNKLKYSIKWLLLRIVSYSCDAIFCIGKKAATSFESFGVKAPKFIIPYNIDVEPFIYLDEIKLAEFKNRYKPKNELVILSSGSLIKRKGMDILIGAMAGIDDANLKLIIIGDGPQKQELMDLRGGDDRIIFAGFQTPEDIPYFFGIADTFAFASRYDGWAVVINEAIAANLPVISSDCVGAAIEMIAPGETGIICESGNVGQFKEAILSLIGGDSLRMKIKENLKSLLPFVSSAYNAVQVYDIFTRKLSNGDHIN